MNEKKKPGPKRSGAAWRKNHTITVTEEAWKRAKIMAANEVCSVSSIIEKYLLTLK